MKNPLIAENRESTENEKEQIYSADQVALYEPDISRGDMVDKRFGQPSATSGSSDSDANIMRLNESENESHGDHLKEQNHFNESLAFRFCKTCSKRKMKEEERP